MLSFSLRPGGLSIVERDISEFTKICLGVIFQLYLSFENVSKDFLCVTSNPVSRKIFSLIFGAKPLKMRQKVMA